MKKNYVFMFLVFCASSSAFAAMDVWKATRCALGFLGAGVAVTGAEYFREAPLAIDVAEYTGLDVDDVSAVACLPLAAFGIRELVNDDVRPYVDHLASRTVPGAAAVYLSQTKIARTVFGNIPLFGKYLRCENEKCTGACQKCKLRTGLVIIGSYMTMARMFDGLGAELDKKGWTGLGYIFSSLENKQAACKPK